MRLPSRRRCDRGVDSVELATAEPGWILLSYTPQPRTHVGAAEATPPPRHRTHRATARAASSGRTRRALIAAQLPRVQRAQLDRPVVRRGCGERGAGPIQSWPGHSDPHPKLQRRVEVRPAPHRNPRVAVGKPRDRRALPRDHPVCVHGSPRASTRTCATSAPAPLSARGRCEVDRWRRHRRRRAQLICDRARDRARTTHPHAHIHAGIFTERSSGRKSPRRGYPATRVAGTTEHHVQADRPLRVSRPKNGSGIDTSGPIARESASRSSCEQTTQAPDVGGRRPRGTDRSVFVWLDRDGEFVASSVAEVRGPLGITFWCGRILSPKRQRREQVLGFLDAQRRPDRSERTARAAVGGSVIESRHMAKFASAADLSRPYQRIAHGTVGSCRRRVAWEGSTNIDSSGTQDVVWRRLGEPLRQLVVVEGFVRQCRGSAEQVPPLLPSRGCGQRNDALPAVVLGRRGRLGVKVPLGRVGRLGLRSRGGGVTVPRRCRACGRCC